MPFRQLVDAPAQSTVSAPITNVQTGATLLSASGFPAIVSGGQLSVTMLDSGNPGYNPNAPFATPFEYQQVNGIAGNVLTFGPGGGAAARSSYAGTTPKAFFAGATIAAGMLAEDFVASAPWKFDEQVPNGVPSIVIPTAGSIPATYLGVNFRKIEIDWFARSSAAALNSDLWFQLNGDTAASYVPQTLSGSNGAAGYTNPPAGGVTTGSVGLVPAASMAAGLFGHGTIKFREFAGAVGYHIGTGESHFVQASTTVSAIYLRSASWNQLVPITSITLGLGAGTFVAGSRITVYLWP